jgi:hypothetical protein
MAGAEVENKKPKVRELEGLDLKYLCGTDKVLFENGVYIPRKDFDAIKDTPGVVKARVDKIAAEETQYCGYDWSYACTTGILRRRKGANLTVSHRTERRREREAQQVAEEQKKAAAKRYVFSSAFLVMVVMAVVGIGSAVMSAYHTSTFLYEGGKPAWAALMTGTMLILFSGTAFTAARYFFQEKGATRVFGMLFTVAGFAVVLYSMFSTLTVNFNQFKWRDDAEAATVVENSEALAAHREQIRILEEEIDAVTREVDAFREEADYWRTQSWRRYDSIQEQLAGRSGYLDSLRIHYGELVGETPGLVEVEALSQETIYTFLGDIFKIKENTMKFFVYVLPACLYDILAPFALSVVLLLVDKRRKQDG